MKLERFALIAEVVSAAAIVVTLIFIVVELRDSTRAQDAATYQEMSRDVQAIFDRLPVQLRVKARAGGEPLNAEEVLEYALYTVMILRISHLRIPNDTLMSSIHNVPHRIMRKRQWKLT